MSVLPLKGRVYVVGDSTVCDYGAKPDNYFLPRFGYGTQLHNYLNADRSQIINLALSGRSSLSFLSERNYTLLKNSLSRGDYLIIGFGHNDEKSADKARFTDPTADFKTPATAKAPSFQYTLYEYYVKLAVDRGAIPVLCTPIVRYGEGQACVHVTADGDYAAAILKLAKDTATAVVDLTGLTKRYYAEHADAEFFHAFTTYKGEDKTPDGMDKTHLNKLGAKQIAYMLLTNLPDDCPLKAFVRADRPPDTDTDFADAINTGYVKYDYIGFNPESYQANKVIGNWYKTAVGGNAAGCGFGYFDGKFTVKSSAESGIIAAGDTFAAVFVQIDESKNFTASAKAKAGCANGAFGLMLRDDVYIDADVAPKSNFVSASVADGQANLSREASVLSCGGRIEFTSDTQYAFTVKRVGQVVEVTVSHEDKTVFNRFTDVSFVGVDNTKMYLCLFASGGLTAEFTEVSFNVTGEAQGA